MTGRVAQTRWQDDSLAIFCFDQQLQERLSTVDLTAYSPERAMVREQIPLQGVLGDIRSSSETTFVEMTLEKGEGG